ncbi:MAG: carotenoid biosynthesis protein [bacterium]|nr:carotenoid biosynthesis protein [bacterium]
MRTSVESIILFILFLAGSFGLSLNFLNPLFVFLTPFFLFISSVYVIIRTVELTKKRFIVLVCVLAATYFIEVAGVKTGIVFGEYVYKGGLGMKVFEVPPVIGLNWLILMLAGLSIASQVTSNRFIASFISAVLLVYLDVLIEPSAIKHNWWSWENGIVPFHNYAAWFIIAFLFSLVLFSLSRGKNNKLLGRIYFMQLCFFVIMHSLEAF